MTAASPMITAPPRSGVRPLTIFAASAVLGGGVLLALSRLVTPSEPFLLAAVYGTLLLPALVLVRAERGHGGIRELLRQDIRLPRPLWWLPVAGAAIPVATWALGATLDAARPVTWTTLAALVLDIVIGLVVINLAEEVAWTGYFQSRAMTRWGVAGGSLVTAIFFTAIHVPLAIDPAGGLMASMTNVATLTLVAVGLRLLIGRLCDWTGGSVLAVALLHSAFNASEELLLPGQDWVRLPLPWRSRSARSLSAAAAPGNVSGEHNSSAFCTARPPPKARRPPWCRPQLLNTKHPELAPFRDGPMEHRITSPWMRLKGVRCQRRA